MNINVARVVKQARMFFLVQTRMPKRSVTMQRLFGNVKSVVMKAQWMFKSVPTDKSNPWCLACLEKDCIVDEEHCEMIRIYLKAKDIAKPCPTAPMQARKASAKTLRSCKNCGNMYAGCVYRDCNELNNYKDWQPRKVKPTMPKPMCKNGACGKLVLD